MKVAIIGSGISGLAISRLLREKGFEVVVFEKESSIGGIARCRIVNGVSYHVTGGHCFNSKHKEVMDYVFNNVLCESNWHKVSRRSRIMFRDHLVNYPIEFAIKEIALFDLDLAVKIVQDYLNTDIEDTTNLATWFRSKFGNTLADEYFIPYNEKIWNQSANDMIPDWVHDKLPLPDKVGFIKALLKSNIDAMPHSWFYYPSSNTQNTFIDALADGSTIHLNVPIHSLVPNDKSWILNGAYKFDLVVNTAPLNTLPYFLNNLPQNVISSVNDLKYNKVTTMLWKTTGSEDTWTYYPSRETLFHRHIHIGNFFMPRSNYTITEAIGSHSFEVMFNEGRRYEYLLEPIDYNVSEHAYVVYDQQHKISKGIIMDYLKSLKNFHTLGRFGEWDYYNMDICIKKAIDLSNEITSLYL